MAQQDHYYIYSLEGVEDFLLTPTTFSLYNKWKYKNLWFRRFYNDEIDFNILAEQTDIGRVYVFGQSEAFTQQLYRLGVKERKEYKIKSIEGNPEDLHGRLYHLENDFTLEVNQDIHGDFRIKMYPADYNGMNQKKCLIRGSVPEDPANYIQKPIQKVYEGPKAKTPEAYRYLFAKKKSGCLGMLIFLIAAVGSTTYLLS